MIASKPYHTNIKEVMSIQDAGILFKVDAFIKAPAKTIRSVYDYSKGDFEGLRRDLSAIDVISTLDHEDINLDW